MFDIEKSVNKKLRYIGNQLANKYEISYYGEDGKIDVNLLKNELEAYRIDYIINTIDECVELLVCISD